MRVDAGEWAVSLFAVGAAITQPVGALRIGGLEARSIDIGGGWRRCLGPQRRAASPVREDEHCSGPQTEDRSAHSLVQERPP